MVLAHRAALVSLVLFQAPSGPVKSPHVQSAGLFQALEPNFGDGRGLRGKVLQVGSRQLQQPNVLFIFG